LLAQAEKENRLLSNVKL